MCSAQSCDLDCEVEPALAAGSAVEKEGQKMPQQSDNLSLRNAPASCLGQIEVAAAAKLTRKTRVLAEKPLAMFRRAWLLLRALGCCLGERW
jgi:hypothetical protein